MWPLDPWARWMTGAHYADTTIRLRRYHAAVFSRTHPDPWRVTGDDVAGHLARCRSPEYAKSVRSSLHMFYRWAILHDLTEADPTVKVPAVRVPRACARPAPDPVISRALMRCTDPDTRLMILLAAKMGLRRAEIAGLHVRDFQGTYARIAGKGGHVRRVPIHDAVAVELVGRDGWLFPSPQGGHLRPDTVGRRISRALGPGWSAHTLRHRLATRFYAETHDLMAAQAILGHASVATTQRYIAVDDDAAWQAVQRC
jgi:integrase